MKRTMVAYFAFMQLFLIFLVVPQVGAEPAPQSSPPLLPSSYYGILQSDTAFASTPGFAVSAYINEIQYATTAVVPHEGQWVYSLKVPADNPATEEIEGGRPGDMVSFLVDGRLVAMAPWQSGSNTQVDLTIEPVAAAQAEGTQPPGVLLFAAIAIFLILIVAAIVWWRLKPGLASEMA